jgi:myo-inositol-1(or 4)-monophosphatase
MVLHQFSEVSGYRMQKPVINVMVKAARQAGNVLLRHMNKLDSLNVFEKGRQDYASEVDALAETEIIRELRRAYPDAAFLAEESGAMGKGRQTFVIDPLDGTSNFLRGLPHFCVSIALVENGEPTDGVIYDPLRNELFTASKGAGATLNDKKIRIGERKDLVGSMLVTGFPPRERSRLAPHLACLGSLLVEAEDIRRSGSAALDLAYVAAGRADAYFEAGVKAWDIAAGILLVREAGGRACDFRGRGDQLLNGGQIVAGNLKIVDSLQTAIVQTGYANAFNA